MEGHSAAREGDVCCLIIRGMRDPNGEDFPVKPPLVHQARIPVITVQHERPGGLQPPNQFRFRVDQPADIAAAKRTDVRRSNVGDDRVVRLDDLTVLSDVDRPCRIPVPPPDAMGGCSSRTFACGSRSFDYL